MFTSNQDEILSGMKKILFTREFHPRMKFSFKENLLLNVKLYKVEKCLHIFFFVFSIPEWSFNPVILTGMYSSPDENYSRRKRVNVRDISQYRQR